MELKQHLNRYKPLKHIAARANRTKRRGIAINGSVNQLRKTKRLKFILAGVERDREREEADRVRFFVHL